MTDAKLAEIRASLKTDDERVQYLRGYTLGKDTCLDDAVRDLLSDRATLLSHLATLQEQQAAQAAELLSLARAYDPNCDEYHYDEQLAAMKAARETVEAMQELATYLGRDPEGCLSDVPDEAMGKIEELEAELERVRGERDAAVADHESAMKAMQTIGYERDAARTANDELGKQIARLTEDLAMQKRLHDAACRMSDSVWADHRKTFDGLTAKLQAAETTLSASQSRADRLLIWLKWFVGDDNVATALRRAKDRGCAEWQLEEIRRLWEGEEAVTESEWKERAERAEGELAKMRTSGPQTFIPADVSDLCGKNGCLNTAEFKGMVGNLNVLACSEHVGELESQPVRIDPTPTPAAQEGE